MEYPKTLNQFLFSHLEGRDDLDDLLLLISDLATIGKIISAKTNRAGLANLLGNAGKNNFHGEEVQKLDEFANNLCKEYLSQTGHFTLMASEEDDSITDLGEHSIHGNYIIALDPLDGSSNIDVNASVGTIFSVHKLRSDIDRLDEAQFNQKGRDQVLAGYIVYGTSTQFIFSVGNGVHEFVLDKEVGEFFEVQSFIKIPDVCTYYSVNEAYWSHMSEQDQQYLAFLKNEYQPKARYIGSLIADFYRNMIKGGMYLYPAFDHSGEGVFEAKLRLNHECKAIAFLAEQAGGIAIDGKQNILDIVPQSIHQTVPLYVGNASLIEQYLTKTYE